MIPIFTKKCNFLLVPTTLLNIETNARERGIEKKRKKRKGTVEDPSKSAASLLISMAKKSGFLLL
jgi:hypothetical protein